MLVTFGLVSLVDLHCWLLTVFALTPWNVLSQNSSHPQTWECSPALASALICPAKNPSFAPHDECPMGVPVIVPAGDHLTDPKKLLPPGVQEHFGKLVLCKKGALTKTMEGLMCWKSSTCQVTMWHHLDCCSTVTIPGGGHGTSTNSPQFILLRGSINLQIEER